MKIQTPAKPRLAPQEVEHFHREGYVIPAGSLFPEAKFQKLKNHFEDMLAALPPDSRPEGMNVPHWNDTALFEWLFADEVLDLVEPITGPDIALFASHFICKPGGDGKRVPWHEDSGYWRNLLDPVEVVTVWLAIDPSRLENGCMQVIPRTHREGKRGFSDYEPVAEPAQNTFANEIIKSQRNDSKAIPIELDPNQASLHDGRLIHGSEANRSQLRRCGFTMRYMSSRVRLTDEARKFHQIYLARGRDLANQAYADPTRTYPELYQQRIEAAQKAGRKEH